MADALKRLAGPANAPAGTSTVFTGTAAHTYTVRHIRIANTTAGPISVALGIGGVAAANLILPSMTVDPGSLIEDDCFIVLSGVETIQALVSATGLTITISGLDQS